MNELFDEIIAAELGVSTEEYIKKIESSSFELCEEIINLVFTEKPEDLIKAKNLFNNI